MSRGMQMVEILPGEQPSFASCLHCEREFGKGAESELVFATPSQQHAIHKDCVDELAEMPTPQVSDGRFRKARRELLADMRALGVRSAGARRRRAAN